MILIDFLQLFKGQGNVKFEYDALEKRFILNTFSPLGYLRLRFSPLLWYHIGGMLEVKDVKIEYYGDEVATLNFAFKRGITLILGEAGSFKSTLFAVIGGIKEIEYGEIVVDGENIEELHPKDRNISLVSDYSLPQTGKVVKALMTPLVLRGVSKADARKSAEKAMNEFGLGDGKIKTLSKVELIKFFEARLSLRETSITMFDEPFHYMGAENSDEIVKMIRNRGGYVLVSSCDGLDVERLMPDYVTVVRGDKILAQGPLSSVLTTDDEYCRKFMGLDNLNDV